MTDLIEDLALRTLTPGVRRAQEARSKPLILEYLRDLTPADVEVLNTIPLDSTYVPTKALRATHHALARLLAQGTKPEDAAATTGHSVGRVRALATLDRGFMDLVEHYKAEVHEQYVNVHARLALLGMTCIEELQERLEIEPGKFTNRELFALAELTFDRSVAPSKGAGAPGQRGASGSGGVNVNVTFVAPAGAAVAPDSAPQIDITPAQKALPNG